jgi:glycosyltransferase involved in cell wall biosynthesis
MKNDSMTNVTLAFMCHPYHRGGVTRWMADAASYLAELGHNIFFITIEPSTEFYSGGKRETMVQLLKKGCSHLHLITASKGHEFEFGTLAYKQNIYRKLVADNLPKGTPIILSDDEAVWVAATSLYKSYKIIGVLHADEQHYYDLGKRFEKHTDLMACVSSRIKLKTNTGSILAEKLPVIPCGINLPELLSVRATQKIDGALQLAYVGRIGSYQKRVFDLFEICDKLHNENFKYHINIVGDGGADKTTLEEKFKNSAFATTVTFHGWLGQQNVAAVLQQTDIVLMTSDFEGTPIAMMEALACGCGFVGTRVSGIEDYETHHYAQDCFRIFETGNINESVTKIKELAAVPAHKRASAARQLAEQEFTLETCMQRYMECIAATPARNFEISVVRRNMVTEITSGLRAFLRTLKLKASAK